MTDNNSEQQTNVPPVSPPPGYYPSPYPYGSMPAADSEIDLLEIWRVLRAKRRLIFTIAIVTTMLATMVAFMTTPKYLGEVVLAPSSPQTGHGGLSSLLSKFGGLASMAGLAGISLPGAGDTDSAIATLTSRKTLLSYVKSQNLKPILFDKRWDAETKTWKRGNFKWLKDILHISHDRKLKKGLVPGEPTDDRTYRLLSKTVVSVNQDSKTSLMTLDVVWKDPDLAAEWANGLVAFVNSELRERDIDDAKRMIAYLTEQANKTDNPDIRSGLYQMIESQEQTMAVAASTTDYAFRIVDPAAPSDPNDWVKPKRKVIIFLGFFAGLFLGSVYAFVRDLIARRGKDIAGDNELSN